jgi:hypothetical protein
VRRAVRALLLLAALAAAVVLLFTFVFPLVEQRLAPPPVVDVPLVEPTAGAG